MTNTTYRTLGCPSLTCLDETDIRHLMGHIVRNGEGPNIVVLLGQTGEFYALPIQDKKAFLDIACDSFFIQREAAKSNPFSILAINKQPLEVAVGITGENMNETLELTEYASEKGADYLFFLPLYVTRKGDGEITRRGVTSKVRTVLDNMKRGKMILYNNPLITNGKNIPTSTWKKLAEDKRVVALKDSSGDMRRTLNYIKGAHGNAQVFVGNEGIALRDPFEGVIAGSSNVLPSAWSIAVRRDYDETSREGYVAERLAQFVEAYRENPIGAFRYILCRMDVLSKSSEKTLDPKLHVSGEQRRALDKLMLDSDFQAMFAWGIS